MDDAADNREPQDQAEPGPFRQWCLVEIMGHKTFAGLVSELTLAGASFLRVDVPAAGQYPAFSKMFGAQAVYCITPVSEDVARMKAAALRATPVDVWDLPEEIRRRLMTPALPASPAASATAPACSPAVGPPADDQWFDDDDDEWDEDDVVETNEPTL